MYAINGNARLIGTSRYSDLGYPRPAFARRAMVHVGNCRTLWFTTGGQSADNT